MHRLLCESMDGGLPQRSLSAVVPRGVRRGEGRGGGREGRGGEGGLPQRSLSAVVPRGVRMGEGRGGGGVTHTHTWWRGRGIDRQGNEH